MILSVERYKEDTAFHKGKHGLFGKYQWGKTSRYRGKCRSVVRLELGHLKFQTYARIYIQLLDFNVVDSSKVINQFVQRYIL